MKSCTFSKNQYGTSSRFLKSGKSEQLNVPKCTKSCTISKPSSSIRTEYVSPYKMSVLQHNSVTTCTESKDTSKADMIKHVKVKTVKKYHKKSISKKSKTKVDESEFHEKLYCVQNRICILVIEIKRGLFEQITVPDGREDLARRKKCEHEFWCRFTRNFNSELGRQIRGFQRLIETKPRTNCISAIIQRRILTMHQIVFQSLSSYLGHMPLSLNNEFNANVKYVIEQFYEALKICAEQKLCNIIPKIQVSLSTLLNFTEEDKRNMMSNYKEMKPLKSESARKKEQHSLIKKLSMYLDRPGQYKLLSKSIRRSMKAKNNKKGAIRLGPDPNGPLIVDPDVDTLVSLMSESSDDDVDEDQSLQQALFSMGNLISSAIDYKIVLLECMSNFTQYFISGENKWDVVTLLVTQLINETIIDMTTWDDEKIKIHFTPNKLH